MTLGQQLNQITNIVCNFAAAQFEECGLDKYLASMVMDLAAARFKNAAYSEQIQDHTSLAESYERLRSFCADLDLDEIKMKEDQKEVAENA